MSNKQLAMKPATFDSRYPTEKLIDLWLVAFGCSLLIAHCLLLIARAASPLRHAISVLAMMLLIATGSAFATVFVDKDATGVGTGETWLAAFTTIQDGIDNAMGDEVWVAEGAYHEAISLTTGVAVYGGFAGGELQLADRNVLSHPATIDGTGNRHAVKMIGCVNSRVDGFTIAGGVANGASPDNTGGGIYCKNSDASNTVANCVISGNRASSTGGGLYAESSSVDVRNCLFSGNSATTGAGAARSQSGGATTFANCVFRANRGAQGAINPGGKSLAVTNCTFADNVTTSSGQGALRIGANNNSASVTNCIFTNNTGCAIVEKISSDPVIESCLFYGNPDGDYSYNDVVSTSIAAIEALLGTNHILGANPMFVDAPAGDYHLLIGSPCIDAGFNVSPLADDIEGKPRPIDGDGDMTPAYDIGAYEYQSGIVPTPSVVFVSKTATSSTIDGTTWESAFPTVSEGLAAAKIGDQVWVATGLYSDSISLKGGVAVYGGFAGNETALSARDVAKNVTTIDASVSSGGQPAIHAVTMVNVSGARLDGFTIEGGHAYGNTANLMLNYGGGVFCSRADATNAIANCVVTNNWASLSGGGVYCFDDASPMIDNCAMRSNTAAVSGGGLYCGDHSSPAVTSCVIEGNSAVYGAGVYLKLYSSPVLLRCRIAGNTASQRGGGLYCSLNCSPDITNCLVSGNLASGGYGGGIYCMYGSSPAVTNCTVADNAATTAAGAFATCWHLRGDIIWKGSKPSFVNTILARNTGKAVFEFDPLSDPSITYSLFNSNTGGDYFDDDTTATYTGAAAITAIVPGANHIFDGDPRFVNPSSGNYRLKPGSSAINAGNNAAPKIPSTDLDGKARINEGTVDLGSYEYYATYASAVAVWQMY